MLRNLGFGLVTMLIACGDDAAGAPDASPTFDGGATDAMAAPGAPESGAVPSAPMDAGSCGAFGQDDVCATCLARECCERERACTDDGECSALVACARACGASDAGDCRQACVDAHGTGRAAYNALVLCMGQRCRAECPFTTP